MREDRKEWEARFWDKVNKDGPVPQHMSHLGRCWEWTAFRDHRGYGRYAASGDDGRRLFQSARRASWFIKHGEIPENYVCHKCDNPGCVRPSHLFVGTHQDNMADMRRKGRSRGRRMRAEAAATQRWTVRLTYAEAARIEAAAKAVGMTKTEYIRQKAVLRAKQLLEEYARSQA